MYWIHRPNDVRVAGGGGRGGEGEVESQMSKLLEPSHLLSVGSRDQKSEHTVLHIWGTRGVVYTRGLPKCCSGGSGSRHSRQSSDVMVKGGSDVIVEGS